MTNRSKGRASRSTPQSSSGAGSGRSPTPWVLGIGALIVVVAAIAAIVLSQGSSSPTGLAPGDTSSTLPPSSASTSVEGTSLPAFTASTGDPAVGRPIPTVEGSSFDGTPVFRCVVRYSTIEEALAGMRQAPHLVLLDIGLPGMSGIEGLRRLRERHPSLAALMITVYEDDDRIFEALCAGASGYLLKKTPPDRLLESLRDAVAGGSPMTPEVARRVVALFREFRPPEKADYQLTPHESRLLKLLVELARK